MMIRTAMIAGALAVGPAAEAQTSETQTLGTQAPAVNTALSMSGLRGLAEIGGLDVVAIEPGNITVSDGKGFPARLSLEGCDPDGSCRVVRAYTRYVIGDSVKGHAALTEHSRKFTGATYVLMLSQDEPAVDVGRDVSLENGRTDREILGEIATAMSDARLLRDALMAADPYLRATLRRH